MPSGITADIYEGKEVSRDQFLQRVARSYSLAIMQREDDRSAPVKRDEVKTRYHDEKIAEAEALLVELSGLSIEEAAERAEAERQEADKRFREQRNKKLALRSRYEAMIREVEEWEPEPLVAYLKDGALKQLRESLEFDVGKRGEEMRYWPMPRYMDGAEWLADQTAKARKDIDYHREQIVKRKKIAAERNQHIDAFLRSLERPDTKGEDDAR